MTAIEVRDISKKFRITHNKEDTLKGFLVKTLGGKKYIKEEFWALQNVSFEIKKGETYGIIGQNGSGKTTLLRMLAGIMFPDKGSIKVEGTVSTLFELGTGFHPELSGRENVYLNGSILGLKKKEIDLKFDSIVKFSELENFIDTPLKFYSSGMQVRLAFSVAININPEIFLVDEVLAVGDASFQEKSFAVMKKFKENGATFVIVSHDLGTIQEFCDKVIYLKKGKLKAVGNPDEIVKQYLRESSTEDEIRSGKKGSVKKDSIAVLTMVKFLDKDGREKNVFETGEDLIIRIFYEAKREIKFPIFGLAIYRSDHLEVSGPNTKTSNYKIQDISGNGYIDYQIKNIPLLSGDYHISVGLFSYNQNSAYDFVNEFGNFQIKESVLNQNGILKLEESWRLHD